MQTRLKLVKNDGGRAAAGFKGEAGDCATRAVAIATGLPYATVYEALTAMGRAERVRKRRKPTRGGSTTRPKSSARTGVYGPTMRRYMEGLGWTWTPTMAIGQGCTVHLAPGELPMGALVVHVSKHYVAVLDGVMHDTSDPSRGGRRCVFGYYRRPS